MRAMRCVYRNNKIHSQSSFIQYNIRRHATIHRERITKTALDFFCLRFLYKNVYSLARITSFHIEQSTQPHPHEPFQRKLFFSFTAEIVKLIYFSFAINLVHIFCLNKNKLCVSNTEKLVNEKTVQKNDFLVLDTLNRYIW